MSPLILLAGAAAGAYLLFGKKAEDMIRSKGPSGTTWQIVNTHKTSGRYALYAVYTDPEAFGVKERTLVVRFATDGATNYVLERSPVIPEGLYVAAASDFKLRPESEMKL